jgi:hypothetical protein
MKLWSAVDRLVNEIEKMTIIISLRNTSWFYFLNICEWRNFRTFS